MEKLKKDKNPKDMDLNEKLKRLEIENFYLKEELKKKEKLLKLKENIKNLDKKIVLVFDPYETYTNLLKTEDPLTVEALVVRMHELEKEKDRKYIEELRLMLQAVIPKILTLIILTAIFLALLGGLIKVFQMEPKVVTQEKVLVLTEEEFEKLYKSQFTNATVVKGIENREKEKKHFENKYIPVEKIIQD